MEVFPEMPPSYRTIDYALRPAKHTERRMLSDIFKRLSAFYKLSDYTYIGFGAVTFTDFTLFHKSLGIQSMISLERDGRAEKRLEYNKPFNAIKIICKTSNSYLPTMEWSQPYILWLDYDERLTPEMIQDARTIASNAESGTALAISFQCNKAIECEHYPDALPSSDEGDSTSGLTSIEAFISNFGREKVPLKTTAADLYSWPYGMLGEKMFLDEIAEHLATRNARLSSEKKMSFHKISTIQYSDNAKMHTLVGMFVSEEDNIRLESCEFGELDFLDGSKSIRIEVPPLTIREIRELERQLPLGAGKLNLGVIPDKEAKQFQKLYRYLPNFSVLES